MNCKYSHCHNEARYDSGCCGVCDAKFKAGGIRWMDSPETRPSDMHIFLESPGVISKESVYVCLCEGYMYTGDTMYELIQVLNTEWKHDKHLIG